MRPAIFASVCFVTFAAFAALSATCQTENTAPGVSGVSPPAIPAIPVISVDFSNPGLSPSHWTLILHPDGGGHFQSEMGSVAADSVGEMRVPNVNRDIQL